MEKIQLMGLTEAEISALVPDAPRYTAGQIFAFLHDGKDIDEMTSLSKALRARLNEIAVANPVTISSALKSRDGSEKYLFLLPDGNIVEGIFMPHDYGGTVCISTQVGCRMGCAFCASGIDGLIRNLTPGEMLGQVVVVNRRTGGTARNRTVANVVLMGSGEPFDNYDNVQKFLDLLTAKGGINVGERGVSVSTSGLADRIRDFADSGRKTTLSISLHSPFDAERSRIMPINRRFGIKALISAARYYFEKTGRRVIFEYTLIAGENDSDADAEALARLVRGFPSHVNLIRLNEVKEKALTGSSAERTEGFLKKLETLGVSATIRRSMGGDVEGACGQLRRRVLSEPRAEL